MFPLESTSNPSTLLVFPAPVPLRAKREIKLPVFALNLLIVPLLNLRQTYKKSSVVVAVVLPDAAKPCACVSPVMQCDPPVKVALLKSEVLNLQIFCLRWDNKYTCSPVPSPTTAMPSRVA